MNVSFIAKLCRLKWKSSDFFYGLCFAAGQVDAEFLGSTVDLVLRFAHLDLAAVGRQNFDVEAQGLHLLDEDLDRKSTRLNSSHVSISYAVFCLKKKTQKYK